MAAGDSDDALVENTVEDRIMDSGASFHATYCKEELERFKLRSGKVRLADDMTLDIAGIGDVVLKTSFAVKVTKGSLVVACGNKCRSLYMVEDWWFGEAEESFLHNVSEDKRIVEVFGCDLFVKVKDVCGEAMKCTFIGSGSDEVRYSFRDTKSHQKKAIIEDMVSLEKNQTCSLVRISTGKKASQILWMFMVKEEHNGSKRCSKKQVLGYVLTVGITTVEWESGLQKSITMFTVEV
ncbi:hypothetical protein Tco_0831714 [Tanacetum coccineum]